MGKSEGWVVIMLVCLRVCIFLILCVKGGWDDLPKGVSANHSLVRVLALFV